MSVTAIIDRIAPYASGWTRTGTRSLLTLIQAAQDELLDYDGHNRIYIDPTDNKGFPPYLKTTAGTYEYSLEAAYLSCGALAKTIGGTSYTVRAKKVVRVFRDVSKGDYGVSRWAGHPYAYYKENPYSTETDRLMVADIPVHSYEASENTTAKVVFLEDPGTQTTVYFVEFTWEAPRIVSESIPLIIPVEYEKAIEDYCLAQIQRFENGAPNDLEVRFENYWKPRFRSLVLTGGASKNNRTVQQRVC